MNYNCKKIIWIGLISIISSLVTSSLVAQETIIALRGGRFIDTSGAAVEAKTLLIKEGRILDFGENISLPEGTKIIDIQGLLVIPGPIDSFTHLGVTDVLPENQDFDEKSNPLTPHLRIVDSLNPEARNIYLVRRLGVTTALIAPGETNVLSGQSALINLASEIKGEQVIKFPVGIHANLGVLPKMYYGERGLMPSTRMGEVALLRQILLETKEYLYFQNRDIDSSEPSPKIYFRSPGKSQKKFILQSLIPLLKKQLPLIIRANKKSDILAALRIAREFDLKIIINHGAESYSMAEELAREKIPVIWGPTSCFFSQLETAQSQYEGVIYLWKAGVKFAFQSLSGEKIEDIYSQARQAVKYGLPLKEAFRALSTYPAQMFGVGDKIGSLEKGKLANLVVWEGNPLLETNSKVRLIIINGHIVESHLPGVDLFPSK